MLRYIAKRLLQMIPLMLIISFIAFGIIRMAEVYANADPLAQLKMNPTVTDETIEREKQRLALDKPFVVRYGLWLSRFVQGDLGESYYYKTPVVELMLSRMSNTVILGIATLLVTWLLAIPLGIWLAVRQYSLADQVFSSVSYFFMGFPEFFLAILMLLMAAATGWFPIGGMTNADNNHLKKVEEIMTGTYIHHPKEKISADHLRADDQLRDLARQQLALDNINVDLRKELPAPAPMISAVASERIVGSLDKVETLLPPALISQARQELAQDKALKAATALQLYQEAKKHNPFGFGTKLQYVSSHGGHIFYHYSKHVPDVLYHLLLPTLTLALISIAALQRRMRANLLDVLSEEYIKTARAKGLSERTVIYKHAVRNAINPIVTLLGFELAGLISGAAFVEIIFSWPGLGNMMLSAVLGSDLNLVMAGLVSGSLMLLLGNLFSDLLLAAVDPRIKLEA